jgi:hypothetical protein
MIRRRSPLLLLVLLAKLAKLASPHPHPLLHLHHPPPGCMGDSISLARQQKKAANYLNQYLREVDKHLPDDIDRVTDEHMDGKHLKIFLENFGNWLTRTSFETKQKTLLGNKSKEEYFKTAKEVLKLKLSAHPCFCDAPV